VIATLEKWLELAGDGLKTLKKDGPGFFKRMVDFNTTNETYAENVARIIVLEDEMDRIGDPPNPKDEKKLKQFQAEHEKCDREASKMIDRINALSEELQQHYDTFKEVFEVKPPKL
ncbi:MAG TPA: hypothetical protein VLA78_09935, partial [Paracoccaceae bacterium]|nr:hypothetical protein [Paracoccaceae bacterium]